MSVWAEHDEESLVTAVAGGDAVAFGVLYRRHLPVVLRWCLRETGNREVAADLSAEVFAAALTSAHRYRAGQGAVLAWLLGIARNKLLESAAARVSRTPRGAGCALIRCPSQTPTSSAWRSSQVSTTK
jgi:DNA-directed RNA polymerase specialized sigma24 family protein